MAESAESCSIVNDLPVVVTGGVAVVRRELAVQTNRFHSFGRCIVMVSLKGVVIRSLYCILFLWY